MLRNQSKRNAVAKLWVSLGRSHLIPGGPVPTWCVRAPHSLGVMRPTHRALAEVARRYLRSWFQSFFAQAVA